MDPTKLRYVLERAGRDELIAQAERLQRGELSPAEAEAMRTSEDPEVAKLYELYRPLDDMEKQRLHPRRRRSSALPWALPATMMSAAAALVLWALPAALRPVSATLALAPVNTEIKGGARLLGPSSSSHGNVDELDLSGCAELGLMPAANQSGSLNAETEVRVYLQQEGNLTPWPLSLRYEPQNGVIATTSCQALPAGALHEGEAKLIFLYGRSLPSQERAMELLSAGSLPYWRRWEQTARPVKLVRLTSPSKGVQSP